MLFSSGWARFASFLCACVVSLSILGPRAYAGSDSSSEAPPDERPIYAPVTLSFRADHPYFAGDTGSSNSDSPNPWFHRRLTLYVDHNELPGPIAVPGYFAGDGRGDQTGDVWRAHFTPVLPGDWIYFAVFEGGEGINAEPLSTAGVSMALDQSSGTFVALDRDPNAPGFASKGFISWERSRDYFEYSEPTAGRFVQCGAGSPENFLGYAGFEDAEDGRSQGGSICCCRQDCFDDCERNTCQSTSDPAPGFLHEYADHVQDWNAGDPDWFANGQPEQGRGIIGAINYLADFCGVNGMYMMLMNLGGDGKDTHPFFTNGGGMDCPMEGSGFDPSHTLNYHVTRMDQWRVVFEHASNKGVMLHLLLAEQEACNIRWFGAHDSNGGVRNHMGVYRRLYMKQMVAQFGHVLGIRWGLCEENKALQACTASGSCGNPATSMTPQFTAAELDEMARWIRAWDPYDHPISVHNVPNTLGLYEELLELPTPPTWLSATSQQIHNEDGTGDGYEVQIRLAELLFASVNYNLAIINDEQGSPSNGLASEFNFNANPTSTTDDRRRRVLYDVLLSGGQIAYYFGYYSPALGGGDLRCESFRTRGNALRQLGIARRLMEEHQIWRFVQRDNLIAGPTAVTSYGRPEAAYREDGARFIVYYPGMRANSSAPLETGRLDLRNWPNRAYKGRWLDPTTGLYLENQSQLFLGGVLTPVFVPDLDGNGVAGDQISSKIDLILVVEEIMSASVGATLVTD